MSTSQTNTTINKSESKPINDVNIISNLPNDILKHILSLLPTTEEVVRTSILSKRWRYLWKSVKSFPSLNIDCSRRLKYFKNPINNNRFKRFVYWALENENVDLDSFSLSCLYYYDNSTIERWIHGAIRRKVKSLELILRVRNEQIRVMPHWVLNGNSLESLKLVFFGRSLSLPNSVRFPALRVLELNKVYFLDDDFIEPVLNSCVVLEEFSLLNCCMKNRGYINISWPKLKTLRIRKCTATYGLNFFGLVVFCPKLVVLEYVECLGFHLFYEDLHSLKKAVILPDRIFLRTKFSPGRGNDRCKLLAVIARVESLSLNTFFLTAIDAASDPEGNLPASLPNLKTLEVTTTLANFALNAIIHILKRSPSLESLHLIFEEELPTMRYWKLDEVETRIILTRHLKRVEFLEFNRENRKFLEFNRENQKLGIARLLLEHGNALEEMVFNWHDKVKYLEKSIEIMNQVSEFHKASATVKINALFKN